MPSVIVPSSLPLGRGTVSWRVLAEPVIFVGGGRALLLQVAHPKVAAGVEQHSTFASDPWARLFRTVDVMTKLGFGSADVSAQQARLLARIHEGVVGTTSAGDRYDAADPELLVWVWATLVDTALRCYERVFEPLTAPEREQYLAEWHLIARACGVPEGACPTTWEAFEAYVEAIVEQHLEVTPEARLVAHATMVPPLPWPLRPVATSLHQLATVGMLPPQVRAAYGMAWDDAHERRLDRWFTVIGGVMRRTPRRVRELPTRDVLRRTGPLQVPWLQRHGARLTARRMAERTVPAARTSGAWPGTVPYVAMHLPPCSPGGDSPYQSEQCALRTLRELHASAGSDVVLVDFDETLLLVSSTLAYLEALRPRLVATAVIAVLRALRPWRWLPSWRADPVYTDYWLRVLVTTVVLPWSLPRWRRRAPALGARWQNRELLDVLRASGRELHVGTFGIRFVVAPMLAGFAPDASLTVAAGWSGAPTFRRGGKLRAFERELGDAVVADAVVVTDSLDDADLLAACRTPVLVRWSLPPTS